MSREIDEAELAAQCLERAAGCLRRRRESKRADHLGDDEAAAVLDAARTLYSRVRDPETDAARPTPEEHEAAYRQAWAEHLRAGGERELVRVYERGRHRWTFEVVPAGKGGTR